MVALKIGLLWLFAAVMGKLAWETRELSRRPRTLICIFAHLFLIMAIWTSWRTLTGDCVPMILKGYYETCNGYDEAAFPIWQFCAATLLGGLTALVLEKL